MERVYPNDFAQWVAMEVRDHVLGERLAVVDPFDYGELDALRGQLISIIDDHLSRTPIVPRVMFGEPFYFNKSLIIQVLTRIEVRTLQEFLERTPSEVEVSAIYFHVFEARHRLKHEESDFSAWIHDGLACQILQRNSCHQPVSGSLERVRSALLEVCDEFLNWSTDLEHKGCSTMSDPSWFKDAVFYELHVKAFHDGNGDGIGDFRGLLRNSTTSNGSASIVSGCFRSFRRPCGTMAMTSPITGRSRLSMARSKSFVIFSTPRINAAYVSLLIL